MPNAIPRTRTRGERGAILILTSVAMVAMMCFAGLAIDVGSVRAQRAQYQATADAAALYATYLIRQPGADVATVAGKVRVFVNQNLRLPGGPADSTWASCADTKHLASIAPNDVAIGNECISFVMAAGDSQARVRLPLLQVKPVIGLGVATMDVTAVAGAEGSGAGCDTFGVAGCPATTTTVPAPTTTRAPSPTTTRAPSPTTTRAPGPTTTRAPSPTTTRAPSPTTTRAPGPTTTRAPSPTTTRAPSPTTTRAPSPTTTRAPSPTTTRAPVPTTLDIGF